MSHQGYKDKSDSYYSKTINKKSLSLFQAGTLRHFIFCWKGVRLLLLVDPLFAIPQNLFSNVTQLDTVMSVTNASLVFLLFYVILLLIHPRFMSIFFYNSLTVLS